MLIRWLIQEMKRLGWDARYLAQKADLNPALVTAILNQSQDPNFEFCYQVALALSKQPERLLNMAGLLSDDAYRTALQLADSADRLLPDIYQIRRQLTLEERRLILRCAQKSGLKNPNYTVLGPFPSEFNTRERRQDRIRFGLIIAWLTGFVIWCSVLVALIFRFQ